MKDIASYFTTPRKCEPVVAIKTKSPSSKKLSNDSSEKACEKRKLESSSDDDVKLKCSSSTLPELAPPLGRNLTVVLNYIDADLMRNESASNTVRVSTKQSIDADESIEMETKSKKRQRKRKRIRAAKSCSSDDEKSDSSGKLFKENKKPTKNRRSGANSLFKYFSVAEKKPITVDDDSPVKCHRVVQVEAIIHSPPRARVAAECDAKLSKTSHSSINDARSPVVKIVRSDSAPSQVLDEIIEIDSDFEDTSHVKKSKPIIISSTDEGESSDHFTLPKIQPWKMRVQFVSGTRLIRRRKKSELKDKKPRDASASAAEKKPAEASRDVAEKSLASETSSDEAAKSADEVDKEVTAEIADSAKESADETDAHKAAQEIPKVVAQGVSKNATAKAAAKKVTAGDLKNFTISLERIDPKMAVKVDTDVEMVSAAKPVIKKLAPLFCRTPAQKKVPSKPVDMEARRQFLESGVPENIKKKMEEQKKCEVEESAHREYRFPEHTHVQQVEPTNWVWNLEEVTNFKVKPIDVEVVIPEFNSIVALISPRKRVEVGPGPEKLNVAEEIATLKKQEPDVNVGDVFTSVKKLGKDVGPESRTLCWTEKYKPTSFSDVIGNATNLLKLKEWIESHKRVKFKISDSEGDSSDDFVDSDDSSCSVETRNNVALLVGPTGCGKTCAVYTLANELGFKVLEVNAASNRNGKRILDELQEATQSHRVKRSSVFDKDAKKSKKKKKVPSEQKKTMSLILIEDADILFENYDDGFLPALSSLTLHSKRPFIFTVNNLNHPHLAKYTKNQTLVLTFAYPTISLLSVWLRSVALNEGVRLSDKVLMYLFHVAGLDLRKSLLQLQMLISSNNCQSALNDEQLFYTDWWKQIPKKCKNRSARQITDKVTTTPVKLFSDDDENEKAITEESENEHDEIRLDAKNTNEKEANMKELSQIANLFKRIAILGNFESANSNQCVAVPCEEISDQSFDSYGSQLSDDIADTIKTKIFSDVCNTDSSFSFREYYRKIRISKDVKQVVDNVFCNFSPTPSSAEAKYCDYLPAIRNIARIESCKVSGQRRTSRYFSYLNSVNIDISERETNFLSNSLL